MAVWEGKKYKMEKSENFDEYMKALGVGLVMRKMGNSVTPTVELVKNGDEFTLNTTSTMRNTQIKFKLGQEFEEETADGRKVKTVMTMDGNKLIQTQTGDKPSTIIRDFSDSEMTATMTIGDVKCVRWYKVQ